MKPAAPRVRVRCVREHHPRPRRRLGTEPSCHLEGIREVASEFTVLLFHSDGKFVARPSFQTVPDPQFGRYDHHLLVADVDHDGITDFVIRRVHGLVVLHGTGGGNFVPRTCYLPDEPFGNRSTGLADVDREGNLDVVTAGFRERTIRAIIGRCGLLS
jgi:hypothetical protein